MKQLKPYREAIDAIDDQIVDLLARRMGIVREVALLKAADNIPAILEDRISEVRERCMARGAALGVDEELIGQLYSLLISHACNVEEEIIARS